MGNSTSELSQTVVSIATTPLCQLAVKYGTDKRLYHTYTPYYYELLKDHKVELMLEIGVGTPNAMVTSDGSVYQTGASLRMWRDFFPKAQVIGVDNDPVGMITDDRISTILCDQHNIGELWNRIPRTMTFDLIVDDGSHLPDDQVVTATVLWPLLRLGGIYIIEDVAYPWIREILQPYSAMTVEFEKDLPTKDNRLVVMRKWR